LDRGRNGGARDSQRIDDLTRAFEEIAQTVDVRCIGVRRFSEFYNISSVGVFVWRLKTYSVTQAPAFCEEQQSPNCFVFSVLGNDTPLYNRSNSTSTHPPGRLNLPTPITRRGLECFESSEATETVTSGIPYYYGDGKS